ncbi:hypothetical protein R3P38DRAFT_3367809 [Favolaschia claudopus]|uniref:F-box domain-containing protein n=1 Tax=Favolaschia claudopus TaxID=2862362 RepID=A0AAW0A7I1_9AGAR
MSAITSFSIRKIVEEQTERTKQSTDSQISESFIEESDSIITSFGPQIASSKLKIEELDHLCEKSAQLELHIAPVRALPVELLAQIFLLAIVKIYQSETLLACPSRLRSKQQIHVEGLKAWFARSAALSVDVRLLDIEGDRVRFTAKFRAAMEALQRRSLNIELRDSPKEQATSSGLGLETVSQRAERFRQLDNSST